MPDQTYAHSVVFSQNTEIDSSLEIKGNLTCSRLVVRGDLTVSGGVISELHLYVTGKLTVGQSLQAVQEIRVGKSLTAGSDVSARAIRVGESLTSSGRVRAQERIEVGQSITAKGQVEAGVQLHCGASIQTDAWVLCPSFDIRCTELRSRLLPLGREFWASLPLLSEWSEQIRDTDVCWPELRRLPNKEEAKKIASSHFGHWSLEGQLQVFLGSQPTTMAPPEAHASIPPITFEDSTAGEAPTEPAVRDQSNPLLTLLMSTVKTPFPDYTGNSSYGDFERALKNQGVLNMDLRQAYLDLDIDLDRVYEVVQATAVPDASVKTQILSELNAATNVRLNYTNTNTFINSSILADDLKIGYVGNMVSVEDGDQCSFNVLGVIESIIDGLSAIPDAGAIFTIIDAISGVIQNGWGGGVQSVNAAYTQLYGALSTQFNKLLSVNGLVVQALLSDWGKLKQANALIIDGTLNWPADDSPAITAAANRYEIEVFRVLFPLHWSPEYSSFGPFYNCTCGSNVLWTGNGFAGDATYWLTYGGYWWGDCPDAENELARIGVSIENLTQGTGLWGSSTWQCNAPVCQERPNCCPKN
ncbi:hypothetical protein JAO29_15290 [Edaphobacter sp. HDX4]|uniref:hypothetical protein n=1 Tax=Edaphobacter sp. HDX4 TaxID=2794064 RepID=UPI002FE5D36E